MLLQAVCRVSHAQEAAVLSTCRYDSVLLLPSVRQSPIVPAVGYFNKFFVLNLVHASAAGVQGFSRWYISSSCCSLSFATLFVSLISILAVLSTGT